MVVYLSTFYYKFTVEREGKRILKIGYHFAELQAKIKWHLFSGHGVDPLTSNDSDIIGLLTQYSFPYTTEHFWFKKQNAR